MPDLTVIGGGLAGSEAAWQAAERGLSVDLYEMRPAQTTGAHTGENLAELVCSNSLGARALNRAAGMLKEEVRRMGSLLLACAEATALPAGGALAVDREAFSALVSARIQAHPRIRLVREACERIPAGPAVIASGPLTSPGLSQAIAEWLGAGHLYFYDAIAPVVMADTIDMDRAFVGSRYQMNDEEGGDYINCPMNRHEYYAFVDALLAAERIALQHFETALEQGVQAGAAEFFEGCLPVEVLAQRGRDSLAYGPLRPVGLRDPRTGVGSYAVLQLRQDNLAATLYNMVGFQTNLKFAEQQRVFRMIPGLERAEFARYGQMHRNTFIHSPAHLRPTLQDRRRDDLFFAGQITGIEGYMGNIAGGLLAGRNVARLLGGLPPSAPPPTTMLGALCAYITQAAAVDFQPMKANFGILPSLVALYPKERKKRFLAYVQRGLEDLDAWLQAEGDF